MLRTNPLKSPLLTQIDTESVVARSFRALRTTLNYSGTAQDVKVLLVASALPAEGKTTTAVNLAIAYALEGKRTLLVDADLRNPTVHQLFSKSNRVGLSHVLERQCSMFEAVRETDIEQLFIVPAGTKERNPSELLASDPLDRWMQELRHTYDMIIIDTPPSLRYADSQILVRVSDGVLLVVRAGKVKKMAVERMKANFANVGARIVGAVLNDVARSYEKTYYNEK